MILLHDILPMVHGKMVYFQRKDILCGKRNWEKLMMKLGKHLIWHIQRETGWKVFVEMLQFGLILGSILIICGVSTIFAEESQTKMLPLIFSTEEGRRKDVPAKILASFTFTIFIFMWFVLVNLVLCWIIYGLKGFENISWMVLSQHMLQPVLFLKYLGILLG